MGAHMCRYKHWRKDGKLHREDGPAIEGSDGSKQWYKDGLRHREDGPALEFTDASTVWYFNGERLGFDAEGFWKLWGLLTDEQRANCNLLKYMPC